MVIVQEAAKFTASRVARDRPIQLVSVVRVPLFWSVDLTPLRTDAYADGGSRRCLLIFRLRCDRSPSSPAFAVSHAETPRSHERSLCGDETIPDVASFEAGEPRRRIEEATRRSIDDESAQNRSSENQFEKRHETSMDAATVRLLRCVGSHAAVLLLLGSCVSAPSLGVEEALRVLKLQVRSDADELRTGATAVIRLSITNNSASRVRTCVGPQYAIHLVGLEERYVKMVRATAVDHPFCAVPIALSPSLSHTWSESFTVPDIPPGEAKLLVTAQILDPGRCDREFGCASTLLSGEARLRIARTGSADPEARKETRSTARGRRDSPRATKLEAPR